APVTSDDVVAAFVDNAAAEAHVKAAVAVVDAADLGDEDAELTVGDAQDHDLAWDAVQEFPQWTEKYRDPAPTSSRPSPLRWPAWRPTPAGMRCAPLLDASPRLFCLTTICASPILCGRRGNCAGGYLT